MADQLGINAELESSLQDCQFPHQHVLDRVIPESGEHLVEGALVYPDRGQVPQEVLHRHGPLPVRDGLHLGDGPQAMYEEGLEPVQGGDPFNVAEPLLVLSRDPHARLCVPLVFVLFRLDQRWAQFI